MSDDRGNFFDSIFNQEDFRQRGYENRTVRRAINECGVKPRSWGRLVNLCRDQTGEPYFSFDWFNDFFPSFPGRLCGKRIGYCGTKRDDNGAKQKLSLYQLTLAELLRPDGNMLVRAISKGLHDGGVDSSRPFIFVFPVVRRMFCAHNLSVDSYETQTRVQWMFLHDGSQMVVEPTKTLFQAIGNDWYQE